ncbi:MAG: M20/M25/M40 family metallo-hydrolase [bacterium]|nr:M20/M25/M40 family metallo-hydrolase [bacterium]
MDVIFLLKQLVAIRSDRNAKTEGGIFEFGVAQFLKKYIAEQLPGFQVVEEPIAEGRVNLFVHDGTPVRLFLIGHMDTVEEGDGWTKNVRGEEKDGKLYGRGSADMKGGIAAIVAALTYAQKNGATGVGALFYCDEEYYFAGMKKFLEQHPNDLKPELVVCPEPTQGLIRRGCRGIIQFRAVVRGKKGHVARPKSGNNAIDAMMIGLEALRQTYANGEKPDAYLGGETFTLSSIAGGAVQAETKTGTPLFSSVGNVIPDYCEAMVDMRTIASLSFDEIANTFRAAVEKTGCTVGKMISELSVGSFTTEESLLAPVEAAQAAAFGRVAYESAAAGGYSDVQMIAEAWNVPAVVWGPKGAGMHGVDEYVDLKSVEQLADAFCRLVDHVQNLSHE